MATAQLWVAVCAIVVPIVAAILGFLLRFEHRMTRVETLLSIGVMSGHHVEGQIDLGKVG